MTKERSAPSNRTRSDRMIAVGFIVRTGSAGKSHLLLIVFSRMISTEACLFLRVTTSFSMKLISAVLFSALSCCFSFLFFFFYFSFLIESTVFYENENDIILTLAEFSIISLRIRSIPHSVFCFKYHVFSIVLAFSLQRAPFRLSNG